MSDKPLRVTIKPRGSDKDKKPTEKPVKKPEVKENADKS